MTTRTAYDWIDDIERMQGGPSGPTIRLRACVLEMENEAFALAAGQCANVVGDEGGTPQCAELTRLRAEVEALKADAERYRWLREHGDTGCTEKDGWGGQTLRIGERLDAAIDAAKGGGNG